MLVGPHRSPKAAFVHSDTVAYCFSFPQIQQIQVKKLVYILLTSDDSVSEDLIKRLQEKLSSLSGARLERSTDTLGTLWEELSKAKVVAVGKEPSTISPVSLRCPRSISPWLRARNSKDRYRRSWLVSRPPCFIRSTRELL